MDAVGIVETPDGRGGPPSVNVDVLREAPSDRVVMIGDTKFDADGAAVTGCDFIGCLYGYGTREEMEEYYTSGKPVFVSSASEITGLII